jgi:hypothetical protein
MKVLGHRRSRVAVLLPLLLMAVGALLSLVMVPALRAGLEEWEGEARAQMELCWVMRSLLRPLAWLLVLLRLSWMEVC